MSYGKKCSAAVKCACSNIQSRPFLSREASVNYAACRSSVIVGEVRVGLAASSQTRLVEPIVPNCQFNDTCAVNFDTDIYGIFLSYVLKLKWRDFDISHQLRSMVY